MDFADLQVKIFQYIKAGIAPHVSVADEVASVLDVSTDSAYRRIRGEKKLSLEEIYKLCKHFRLSLDSLLNLGAEGFFFTGTFMQPSSFRYEKYLESLTQNVKVINSFAHKKMYYICKDIPFFHHFHFREIAAFKHYFWMKTIMQSPDFANKKFHVGDFPDELYQLGRQALGYYNNMESVEIWNIENINSTIRQIEFYQDSGLFPDKDEACMLYDALDKLLLHLEAQADLGYKFMADDPSKKRAGAFEMYFNEVILGDNSIVVEMDESKAVFIVHSVINFMLTRDARFAENMHEYVHNLMKKSTLISSVSERERARFFRYLRGRIEKRKQMLNA